MNLIPDEPKNVVCLNGNAKHVLEITRKNQEAKLRCYGVHKSIVVDSEKRIIECKHCGRVVDPFDYLEAWAIEGDRRMEELKRIEAQRRIASAEHCSLTKQIKNLRATLKRHGHPQSAEDRQYFQELRWNPGKLLAVLEKPK